MVVIDTSRLHLRFLAPDDAPFILALLNDADFLRYIGDRGVRTLEDATAYITNGPVAMYEQHGHGLYLVIERDTLVPAGICGVLKRDTLDEPDLGFAFLPAFRGRGYAREAASATVDFARITLGLPSLAAVVQADNDRSVRLLIALGFRHAGTVRLAPDAQDLLLMRIPFQPSPPVRRDPHALHFCTQCGQQVDAYEHSPVESGNPAGDRTYFCRTCGLEWPAPNLYEAGVPCTNCGWPVTPGLRHCAACGQGQG